MMSATTAPSRGVRDEVIVLKRERTISVGAGGLDGALATCRELLDEGVAASEFHVTDTRRAALAIGGMVSWDCAWYRLDGRLTLEQASDERVLGMIGVPRFMPAQALRDATAGTQPKRRRLSLADVRRNMLLAGHAPLLPGCDWTRN